jgi:predicted transcriptional regulator
MPSKPHATMTPDEFRSWRARCRLTMRDAADALGISYSSIIDYENGFRRGTPGRAVHIPRTVQLACLALERIPGLLSDYDLTNRPLKNQVGARSLNKGQSPAAGRGDT